MVQRPAIPDGRNPTLLRADARRLSGMARKTTTKSPMRPSCSRPVVTSPSVPPVPPLGRSLCTTAPPFITKLTCSRAPISSRGLPGTAIRSANLPASIEPIRSAMPSSSAASAVAAEDLGWGHAGRDVGAEHRETRLAPALPRRLEIRVGPGGDRDSQLDRPSQPVVVGVDKSLDTRGHLGRDGRGRVAFNGREVGGDEEDVFLRHDLEHVVGHGVGVFDRINARLGGDPRRLVASGVGGDLLLDAVGFLDDDLHLLQRHHAGAGVDDDLNTVSTVVESLPHGASGLPRRR